MSTDSCTLSGLMKLHNKSNRDELRARLESQKANMGLEVGIPWRQIEKKMVEKVVELLDSKLLDLCLAAWKKYEELQELADPEKFPPDEANEVTLLEHEILSEQHPGVEIVIHGLGIKRQVTFDLEASLTLKGCSLVIKGGRIMKATPGKCAGQASLKFKGVVLAEAKTDEVQLGPAVDLGEGIPIARSEETRATPRPVLAT